MSTVAQRDIYQSFKLKLANRGKKFKKELKELICWIRRNFTDIAESKINLLDFCDLVGNKIYNSEANQDHSAQKLIPILKITFNVIKINQKEKEMREKLFDTGQQSSNLDQPREAHKPFSFKLFHSGLRWQKPVPMDGPGSYELSWWPRCPAITCPSTWVWDGSVQTISDLPHTVPPLPSHFPYPSDLTSTKWSTTIMNITSCNTTKCLFKNYSHLEGHFNTFGWCS